MAELKKLKPEEYSEARKEAMKDMDVKVTEQPKAEVVKVEEPIKKEIVKTEPTKNLIADIVKLYAKYYERARVQTIMYYWELGKRLNTEYGKPKARGENLGSQPRANLKAASWKDSSKQLIKKLREIGITICERNISYARKFAFKFPQVEELIKQQDVTWRTITHKLLVDKNKQPKLTYNSRVFKSFERWNDVSNGFFKILDQLDYKEIRGGEKEECLKILKRTKQRLEKRIKELEQ